MIFDPYRTGFEESKNFTAPKGSVIAGRYEVDEVLGQAAFSTALQVTCAASLSLSLSRASLPPPSPSPRLCLAPSPLGYFLTVAPRSRSVWTSRPSTSTGSRSGCA